MWVNDDKDATGNLSTQKLCDLFQEFAEMGVRKIVMSGGEPLMRDDFQSLVRYLSNKDFEGGIFTNGTLMDNDNAKVLAGADFRVIFSIDGGSAHTHDRIRGVEGVFDKAVQGVRNMVKAKMNHASKSETRINFTVQKENLHEMIGLFKLAEKLGADAVDYDIVDGKPKCSPDKDSVQIVRSNVHAIRMLAASSKTNVSFGEILRGLIDGMIDPTDVEKGYPAIGLFRKKTVQCLSAYRSAMVDSFGNVYPCCYPAPTTDKQRRHFILGSIHDTSFEEIWYGESYDRFRDLTDPVDIEQLGFVCGQCARYFTFRKYEKLFNILNKIMP